MQVNQQNEPSTEVFSRNFLKMGNGKIPIDRTSELFTYPDNLCNFATSKEETIHLINKYRDHQGLRKRSTFAAPN